MASNSLAGLDFRVCADGLHSDCGLLFPAAMKLCGIVFSAAVAVGLSAAALGGTQGQKAAPAASQAVPAPAELDKLIAPVALYPDTLLGQVLMCAGKPARVGALSEWLRSNDQLKGTALQDAAKAAGFEPACVALVIFPDVINAMAGRLDWTASVGGAFAADPKAVIASVQRLRKKAQDAGKLKDTPQQDVETVTSSSGQQVIVIEPANPQVVYVPQYNATTVYTPATTSNTVVIKEDDDSDAAVAAGLIGFTAGIALGAAMDNDYYYGPYGWGGGFRMYDDAWDDWYDHREDAREDWMDHREDVMEERGDRSRSAQEQRTERTQSRQENRPETQAQRDQRRTDAKSAASSGTAPSATATSRSSTESRGYSKDAARTSAERSGTKSDAFSGYSSGRSERAASSRGNSSRSSSRGGGGSRRR
jgi:hypothetical protein